MYLPQNLCHLSFFCCCSLFLQNKIWSLLISKSKCYRSLNFAFKSLYTIMLYFYNMNWIRPKPGKSSECDMYPASQASYSPFTCLSLSRSRSLSLSRSLSRSRSLSLSLSLSLSRSLSLSLCVSTCPSSLPWEDRSEARYFSLIGPRGDNEFWSKTYNSL